MTYFLPSGPHHRECHQSGPADPPNGTAHTVVNTEHFWQWNQITELCWCYFIRWRCCVTAWDNSYHLVVMTVNYATSFNILLFYNKCLLWILKSVLYYHNKHFAHRFSALWDLPCQYSKSWCVAVQPEVDHHCMLWASLWVSCSPQAVGSKETANGETKPKAIFDLNIMFYNVTILVTKANWI